MNVKIVMKNYTANVYSDLQGLYGEIGVQGFQIYGDCMLSAIPVIFEVNTLCGLLIYMYSYFFSNFLRIFAGIAGIHAIPVIITCTLQGTLCDTGFPRTF